jgi:Ohr subfamily peroxiredoxin
MPPVTITPLYTATATSNGAAMAASAPRTAWWTCRWPCPRSWGGPGGTVTNPEQLFAAGYSACFEGALRLVAGKMGKNVKDASITASATLGKTPDGGFGLSVELKGKLPGLERAEAEQLMHAAHQVCPYSKATRDNIDVKLSVE